jgi:hypothetical protein
MTAQCSPQPLPGLSPTASPKVENHHQMGHFVYQAATLTAILLFLISFWSC